MTQEPPDPLLRVHGQELRLNRGDRLGRAEEQHPVAAQRILQPPQRALLGIDAQIDQEVAAGHQVDPREGRIRQEVVPREDHALPQLAAHQVPPIGSLEIALEELRRHLGRDAVGIAAGRGDLDVGRVDVGGEDLDPGPDPETVAGVERKDAQRIGLFPRGGGGRPEPQRRAALMGIAQQRLDHGHQRRERLRVAEEAGDRNQDLAAQHVHLGPVGFQQVAVFRKLGDAAQHHPPLDAAPDRAGLVIAEVDPGRAAQAAQDVVIGIVAVLVLAALALGQRARVDPFGHAQAEANDLGHPGPEVVDRPDAIHQPRSDHRDRHAVEFRVDRGLCREEPARLMDRPCPARPVRPGAREHHADGARAPDLGRAVEEFVDRQAQHARLLGHQRQLVALHPQDRARRDQMHHIGLQHLAVGHRQDRHRRVPRQQRRHHALVVGRQVLDDHIGRAGVGRQAIEEPLQRVEAPRRGPDRHQMRRVGPTLTWPVEAVFDIHRVTRAIVYN